MTPDPRAARPRAFPGAAARALLLACGFAQALSGCAFLPRSGPLAQELEAGEGAEGENGLVAPLTAETAALTRRPDGRGFPPAFHAAAEIDPSRLGVDDVVEVVVWETGPEGVLGVGAGATVLGPTRIDPAGRLFVPFAGPVPAAGATLGELRGRIRAGLERITLSPQVDVRLVDPRSRAITVQGSVQRPGPYVLDRGSARLAPLLALAGGSTLPPEQTEVVIRRGAVSGSETLRDVYSDPALDVALAPRDALFLNPIRERFIVLGASSIQGEIQFPTRPLDLLGALGAARGLDDFSADPTGVFVFRREDPAVADRLLPGARPEGLPDGPGRPIIYRLDLTEPESLFVARSFEMRDGDAIFATNAPLTEFRKLVSLFQTSLVPVASVGQAQRATTGF
jgi:polysaccharide export outer membrane protein